MSGNMKLVMVWRRVRDLQAAGQLATQVLRLPMIGEDEYTRMYDAGNVILAYWSQETLLSHEDIAQSLPLRQPVPGVAVGDPLVILTPRRRASSAAPARARRAKRAAERPARNKRAARSPAGRAARSVAEATSSPIADLFLPIDAEPVPPRLPNQCSLENLLAYPLTANPASQLTFLAPRLEPAIQALNLAFHADVEPAPAPAGTSVSFMDESGHTYAFLMPMLQPFMTRELRATMNAFLDRHEEVCAHADQAFQVDLQVSNPRRSQEFYRDVLGLSGIGMVEGTASYDAGPILLSLRRERTAGLLRSLRRTARIRGDLFVFHVDDLEVAIQALARRGVQFPYEIEISVTGRMANFSDPDGYSLTLWEPAGPEAPDQPIDFYPVLHRLLARPPVC